MAITYLYAGCPKMNATDFWLNSYAHNTANDTKLIPYELFCPYPNVEYQNIYK